MKLFVYLINIYINDTSCRGAFAPKNDEESDGPEKVLETETDVGREILKSEDDNDEKEAVSEKETEHETGDGETNPRGGHC